jgi:hypothetical protein
VIQKRKVAAAILALTATLTLSACGGSSDNKAGSDTTGTEAPKVVVDPKVKAQLNPEEGQAIVPGSIESETVTGLSSECEAAVAPIREYTSKFESGLAVDPETLNKVAELKVKAEGICEAQEYTDWYTKEFAGWLYAETKK